MTIFLFLGAPLARAATPDATYTSYMFHSDPRIARQTALAPPTRRDAQAGRPHVHTRLYSQGGNGMASTRGGLLESAFLCLLLRNFG